jgi:hypothetical protein
MARICQSSPATAKQIANAVRIVPLGEKRNAAAFRPTRPLHERLAALQEILLEYHCWKGDAASGLRKAHRTVKQV